MEVVLVCACGRDLSESRRIKGDSSATEKCTHELRKGRVERR